MIRKINKAENEIDRVMELWLRSTIKGHPFISEEYWRNNYSLVKDEYIPNSDTYVYEDGDGIIGFVSIINKEFIGALFVDVDMQGKGIGKKLINHVMGIYGELTLAVYKENSKAVNFYKYMGFSIIDEQPNEDTGKIEYIMRKREA